MSLPADHEDVTAKIVAAMERVGQALRVRLREEGLRHGVSPVQAQLLLRLAHDSEERRRPGALARELDVTPASVSDSLAALERKGLIERRRRSRDGRSFALSVTGDGRRLADRLAGWSAPIERAVDALPAEEQLAVMRSLFALIASLEREGVVSIARMCITCRHFRPDAHPDAPAPHHCALLDRPLGERTLRIDCPEHEHAA